MVYWHAVRRDSLRAVQPGPGTKNRGRRRVGRPAQKHDEALNQHNLDALGQSPGRRRLVKRSLIADFSAMLLGLRLGGGLKTIEMMLRLSSALSHQRCDLKRPRAKPWVPATQRSEALSGRHFATVPFSFAMPPLWARPWFGGESRSSAPGYFRSRLRRDKSSDTSQQAALREERLIFATASLPLPAARRRLERSTPDKIN
jgi:hypothetical protein